MSDLLNGGVRPGGVLLTHISFRSLGSVPGGMETLIASLLEALGPRGTLLMPALSYETVNADNPVFDVRSTPSCIGAVPEYFRCRPGSMRSVHPTHSVCGIGPRAEEMLGDHYLDTTPVGPRSAFRRLRDCGGQVAMIGCGLGPCTSMHGVEELAEAPYLFGPTVTYSLTHGDGHQTTMGCRRHDFPPYRSVYERLEDLLTGEAMRTFKVLRAGCYLLEASQLWAQALAAMSKDPLHFVSLTDR